MPLEKSTSAFAIFLKIHEGKVCRNHKEPTEHTVPVINKNNKTEYLEKFDTLTAKVTKITFDDKDEYNYWNIHLHDGVDEYKLSLSESNNALTFLGALFNADLSKDITIKPYWFNKDSMGISVYQGKIKLHNHFFETKEVSKGNFQRFCLNGYPEMPATADKNQKAIVGLNRKSFLKTAVFNSLIPNLNKLYPADTAGTDERPDFEGENKVNEDGDLPF